MTPRLRCRQTPLQASLSCVHATFSRLRFFRRSGGARGSAVRYAVVHKADSPFGSISVEPAGNAAPVFVDVDGDGKTDAVVSMAALYDGDNPPIPRVAIWYYRRSDECGVMKFTWVHEESNKNPFKGIRVESKDKKAFNDGNRAKVAFVDADLDGDLDMVIGRRDGTLDFYKNTGGPKRPMAFTQGQGDSNPFASVNVGLYGAAPAFSDVDGPCGGARPGTLKACWVMASPSLASAVKELCHRADRSSALCLVAAGDGIPELLVGADDGGLYYYKRKSDAKGLVPFERKGCPLKGEAGCEERSLNSNQCSKCNLIVWQRGIEPLPGLQMRQRMRLSCPRSKR